MEQAEYTAKDFYKDEITRIINRMKNEKLLRSIWIIISDFAKEEGIE